METMIWYEIEVSAKGADDWFATNHHADTEQRIREKIAEIRRYQNGIEYRAVQKTMTTTVLSD
jgi:hypothetical protein